jgi:hypothetical protein
MSRTDSWAVVLWVLAAINLANGVWMLVAPEGWYFGLPAAVPDTGPLNLHFVRDIGATYVTMAAALFWAASRRADRVALVAMVLLFHVLHAAEHVLDTLAGRLPASHWLIDFPGVYLPTIVLAAVLWRLPASVAGRR